MAVSEEQIVRGLVLHLDPNTLAKAGGTCTCTDAARVQGGHFFLCLSTADDTGRWMPLYSNAGVGRTKLSEMGRSGHEKWTGGTFYQHKDQVWTASHAAVVSAAAAGGDMSRPGNRNTLDDAEIPDL